MTISDYESLTGTTVTNEALVTAQIARTQRMLEVMLGYSLDPEIAEENHYTEIGKTATDCPCPDIDVDALEEPDAVVGAYRLFEYNHKDKFFFIDPATEIYKVKLVRDGITLRTLDEDDYRKHYKNGFIKYIEECDSCCFCSCKYECYCSQLAIDGDWLWGEGDTIPSDLLDVWASMAEYYSDSKKEIKSETLGSHSYTRNIIKPEELDYNMSVIRKYTGGNGSINRTITV